MRPVTDAFLRTVAASHRMVARATVCDTFQTTTTPVGQRINILAGQVTVDGTAEIRSTLDLLTDQHWPRLASDLLAPYGNEIYVESGVMLSDFLVHYVGLGYFRIDEPEQDEQPGGPVQLTCQDRMAGIIDGRLTRPKYFAAGTTLGTIVTFLVTQVYPAAVIEWDDATDTQTLARSAICTEDRFGFLDELVRSRGKVWYWDHRGALVIKTMPDPTPVVDVHAGAGGVLVGLSRKLSRRGVYNAVVATGEGADTAKPARGVAIDNNSSSPTYYHGRFGPVPRFFTSPFLATNDQAFAAASAMLRRSLGLPYSVDFRAVPNPALEPWDAVSVRPDGNAGVETHVIESLTIPLTRDEPMSAETREQTVVLVGSA